MEHDHLQALVERSQKEFVASFAADYNRLIDLAGAAGTGDSAALVELQLAAHRLVGRAGIVQFLLVARHAAALDTLARVEDVRHFDRGAASACLVALREAFVDARAALSSGSATLEGVAPVNARALVLVADDDDDQRYLLTRVLQRAGFDVIEAATGNEALALARARLPAAILLDVQMPDQDGLTTGRLLKAERETSSIPLMFLSARSDAADRAAGRAVGAEDYVSKTVDPRELIDRVRAMCTRLKPSSD
jgi:CheY-like chemotaxis protein